MSGIFQINVSEERGQVATTAEADRLAIVLGCSATAPAGLSSFFLSGASAKSACGYGDGVDTLCQCIEQIQDSEVARKYPAAFYNLGVGTAGSCGTVDASGVQGTVQVAMNADTHPNGTYQGYLRCISGGFIGSDGIEFVYSSNDGRDESEVQRLGTASSFEIPNTGMRFVFSPTTADLTALNTLINELFTQLNDHVVLTSSAVHGAADNAHVVSAETYPSATNTATRVARINAIRAAYELHRATTGSVHGSIDATNRVTANVATDDATALALANNLSDVFNDHIINVASSVHGSADTTNTVTAASPVAGSLLAGDIVRVRTNPPVPTAAAIDAAFVALANSSLNFRLVFCEFPCTRNLAEHIATGRARLLMTGKRTSVAFRVRDRNYETGETDAAWQASVETEYRGLYSSGVFAFAAYGLIRDAMTSRRYLRSLFAQFAADVIRVDRYKLPDVPADRAMPGCSLVDDAKVLIGHDEGTRGTSTGLSNETLGNRFISVFRLPDGERMENVFLTVPWCMYAPDEKIRTLPARRIANAMEADAVTAGNAVLGGDVRYFKATQTDPATLTDASVKMIHGQIFDTLKRNFANDIENANDASLNTGLVQVNPVISVNAAGLVRISVKLSPSMFGYVVDLDLTLSVQQ